MTEEGPYGGRHVGGVDVVEERSMDLNVLSLRVQIDLKLWWSKLLVITVCSLLRQG